MDIDSMTEEELAALIEDAKTALVAKQSRAAVVRDVTGLVDRILAANPALRAGVWESGRVSWDGERLIVVGLDDYSEVPVEPEPEPEASVRKWEPGLQAEVGERYEHQGVVYVVVQAHPTLGTWPPDQVPSLYRREG